MPAFLTRPFWSLVDLVDAHRRAAQLVAIALALAGVVAAPLAAYLGLSVAMFVAWATRRRALEMIGNAKGAADAADIVLARTSPVSVTVALMLALIGFTAGIAFGRAEPIVKAGIDMAAAQRVLVEELKRELDADKVDAAIRRLGARANEFVEIKPTP